MSDLKTVAIKSGGTGYRIINESDFDEKKGHVRYEGTLPRDVPSSLRPTNADGTYDTPTPTDVRFPDMDNTEFANNHGAHVNRSAAEMRKEMDLPDAPGGLQPDPVLAEAKKKQDEADKKAAAEEAKKATDEAKKTDKK